MAERRAVRSRRPVGGGALVTFVLLLALVGGYAYIAFAEPGRAARAVQLVAQPVTAAPVSTAARPPAAQAPSAPAADESSPPVRVTIASIGVSSSLQALGLLPDGSLQPPSQWQQAGWYAKGVVPGSVGPAVIAGHVDSVSGPAVFYRLRDVKLGDIVTVQRKNGTTLRFVVDDIQSYPKAQFPSSAVYGPTSTPVLRLVTCTGDFDSAAHSYVDNLVVTSHLA